MMKEKSKAPLQVVNGKETPKKEIKKTAEKLPKAVEPTKDDLLKKVFDLEQKLSKIPRNLDEKIEYYNRKRELITRLSRLKSSHIALNEHLDKLAELSAENEFETEEYLLTIENGSNYSKTKVFKLDNPVIIANAIGFIVGMIEEKEKQIKSEIEA